MPEIFFDSLDAVPADFRDIAKTGEGGKISINVVAKTKLDEFRDTNIAVSAERDKLKTTVEKLSAIVGEDADAFSTELEGLRATAQQVADGKLKGNDSIEKEVANRVASMKTDYENRLQAQGKETKAWQEKAESAEGKFRRSVVAQAVTNAVVAEGSGADPKALPDILERAYKVFHVEDNGALVPKEGEATIYGGDGTTPQTPSEWLGKLKESAPYFFKRSTGADAGGNGKGLPGGISQADFDKLSGAEKLALARKHNL